MLAGQTYEGRPSEAEHRYLDVAQSLGWEEGSSSAMSSSAAADDETEEGQEESGGGGGGDGSGMGISVSVISPPTLDEAGESSALHGYAMRDDVAAISAFLSANEGADINVRDEYVSFYFIIPPAISSREWGGDYFELVAWAPSSLFT